MARKPLRPLIRGGGFYPSRKWTPLVYAGGYTTANGGGEPEPPPIEKTITGNPIHITDALAKPVQALSVKLEPIQDLNGYGNPWPAGGGKNKIDGQDVTIIASTDNQYVVTDSTVTLAAGTYTLSFTVGATVTSTRNRPFYLVGGAATYASSDYNTQGRQSWTFTLVEETTLQFKWWGHTLSANCTISDFMLELGSTASSFAPYSNICPISGYTDADVTRTGKNLFDKAAITPNSWIVVNSTTIETAYSFFVSDYIPVIAGRKIICTSRGASRAAYYDKWKNPISYFSWSSGPLTPLYDGYIRITDTNDHLNTLQVEFGTTITDYEASQAETYPIPLGQTVYGGTLDVTTGVLTVTMAMVDLGTLTWAYLGAFNCFYATNPPSPTPKNSFNALCSQYKFVGSYPNLVDKSCAYIYNNTVAVRDSAYGTDAATFKTAVTGQTLVYELATPQTIQLTPQQVELLLGENNIWSDGTMTLVYLADGNASDEEALNILLGNRYVNNHEADEPTDREALDILLSR